MPAPAVAVPLTIAQPVPPRRSARPRPARPRRGAAAGRRPGTPQIPASADHVAPVTGSVPAVTVTISVGAGDPAHRDRVIAALGELIAAARPGLTTLVGAGVAVEPAPALPAPVRLYPGPRTVTLHGRPVELSRREYDLLSFLVEHPRRVFSRTHLLETVWGDLRPGTRTVDVHISRLRRKLTVQSPVITTVRGVGYRLADDAPVTAAHR
jgi:hypothetical protein